MNSNGKRWIFFIRGKSGYKNSTGAKIQQNMEINTQKSITERFGVIILINWHAILMNVVTIRLDIIILVSYDGW